MEVTRERDLSLCCKVALGIGLAAEAEAEEGVGVGDEARSMGWGPRRRGGLQVDTVVVRSIVPRGIPGPGRTLEVGRRR